MSTIALAHGPDLALNSPSTLGRVLVTRPADQAAEVASLLTAAGFEPVVVPTIQIEVTGNLESLDERLARPSCYDWAIFSSANAARIITERMALRGIHRASWHGVQVVAGPATARVLADHGLPATRIVAPFSARAVLEALEAAGVAGRRVLLPRADGSREELSEGLRARGATVDEVVVYRTVPVRQSPALLQALERGIATATFFSPSAVCGFVAAVQAGRRGPDRVLAGVSVACVGSSTAAEARASGLRVDVIPSDTTARAMVTALLEHHTSGSLQ